MGIDNPEVWLSHLHEALPEEKLISKLSDAHPEWEYIDGEIVKLGSLNHAQVDIQVLQQRGLALLASESKDFRLVSHLLRTLQQTGETLLAVRILTEYVACFWQTAWPQNAANKKRFADQILKRFSPGVAGFASRSSASQRDALLAELAKLALIWHENAIPQLATAVDDLSARYQQAFRETITTLQVSHLAPAAAPAPKNGAVVTQMAAPAVTIDSHDDRAWRDTLLRVADILCEQQPVSPHGYRLRRHALWQNITSAPQAESDGRTSLAAVPADMVADYQARLASADIALWLRVEKSLLLAPYWLDGHYLSAQIAQHLGYSDVAQAVRDEVRHFAARLPSLDLLLFNDRSPFISDATRKWLTDSPQHAAGVDDMALQARQRYEDEGLEAALAWLEQQPDTGPREQFYREYLTAQWFEVSGMTTLARQHYRTLYQAARHVTLTDWEPELLQQLEDLLRR
jgi:type VI secretion system protein VasJ